MKDNTNYFSHDYNASNDYKILLLRSELGMEGYGIYWYIIERLADAGGKLPKKIIPVLAMETHTSADKIEKILNNFELFESDENQFFSERLLRHLDFREHKKTMASIAGKKSAESRKSTDVKQPVQQTFNDRSTSVEQRKEKKRKEKEIKEKIDIVETMNYYPFSIGFEKVWTDWKRYKHEQHNFKFKSDLTEKNQFNQLVKLSEQNESYAIELLNLAMSRGWASFHIPDQKKIKYNEPANRDQARIEYWNHMVDTFGTDEEKATRKIV
jgi:uncharacterized protein YdaU (DUF1376 family)